MTTAKQPSHLIYHVEEREGDTPNNWTQVGAMWPHKDSKGWNMQLQFLPVSTNGKLTIRVNEPNSTKKPA